MFERKSAVEIFKADLMKRDPSERAALLAAWTAYDAGVVADCEARHKALMAEIRAAAEAVADHHRSSALFPARAKMLRAEIAAQQAAMDEAARSVKVLMGTEDCARERLEAYAALRAEVAA